MDVSRWLADQGLGHHAEVFARNGIAGDVLRDLTDADLKELGLNLGDRKRLLKAIAALDAEPAQDRAEPAEHTTTAAVPRDAERRQLTVMFVDLVGSTKLASRLDPEDMGALVRAYHAASREVVERWDGHVAKYMGDGVLAYFGYPHAHEDDAERAVRAGLELAVAIDGLKTEDDASLAARVGIATGLVMVGELIGEGAAKEQTVVGETPNLAARLQAVAAPGAVVVAASTRRLLGGLFEFDDLGAQALKGFAEAVRAFRVVKESESESRFDALHGRHLTPLVGREHELGLLLDRWERAKDGEGQVVLLSGEPGIGKSRLVAALREAVAEGAGQPLLLYCSPYHTSSALHPVIDLLERAAGIAAGDPAQERLDKLIALLSSTAREDSLLLLAPLLDIDVGDRFAPLELTPQVQKRRTLEALASWIEAQCARQPLLVVLENAHWLDPSTQELFDLLAARAVHLPLLLLVTYRPDASLPWGRLPHVTAISLSRLSRGDAAAIARRVGGRDDAIPDEMVDAIVARTDGVPLFVEELTKAVRESEHPSESQRAGEGLVIPTTLHDALLARLDRLGPAKELAQIAAVIGREFSHALLVAVARRSEPEVRAALDQIAAAELIFRRGTPPDATYIFKHALVRDAAYDSLLKVRRREVHARVVAVLEADPAHASDHEVLAHHSARAELFERAVDYRYQAGRDAVARSAMPEAVAQLRQGLEALAACPDTPDRGRRELDLQIALGGALIGVKGYAAAETGDAFARARALCGDQRDHRRLMPVLNGEMLFHSQRGESQAAHRTAEEMLQLAERVGDPALLIPAHRALSVTSMHLGRPRAVRRHAEMVLALYEPAQHRRLAAPYAFDQRTVALGFLASALLVLGYVDQGRKRSQEAVVEARQLRHPNTLAQALYMACFFQLWATASETAREPIETLASISQEHGLAHFLAMSRIFRGHLLIVQGRGEDGVIEVEHGAAAVEATGTLLMRPYTTSLLAQGYATMSDASEALRWSEKAQACTARGGSGWFVAEAKRIYGSTLLLLPEPSVEEAEACFVQALEVARQQEARMYELRAANSLAKLWAEQGERQKAHDLLAPIYGWFTEGFDTADLKDAKALLDELA